MINILLFCINFLLYSVFLFIKYFLFVKVNNTGMIIEGYFMVNLFFGMMIFPVCVLHKHAKDIYFFINLSKFSKYIKIPLLLLGLVSTAVIFKLPLPYDVMSSFVIWLYLYFCNIF
jgi:hypothetical protein